jgi:hypothetical protein
MARDTSSSWRITVWLVACIVAITVLSGVAAASVRARATVTVRVDASHAIGRTNTRLVGFGATASPGQLSPLRSRTFRIDASLQDLVDCPSGVLNAGRLAGLQTHLDALTAAGGDVILIIDYMPRCLAAVAPGDTGDPTRLPPADPVRWQRLVAQLVQAVGPERAAMGKRPVRYYEVWNEPDLAFFRGTIQQFETDVMIPEGRAVAEVASASRMSLRFGVCGCTFIGFGWIPQLLQAAATARLPIGFVSWHWYGNFPNVGPDGREPGFSPDLYKQLAGRNPTTTPQDTATQIAQVRTWALGALGHVPELIIDEWNLSSAGFDRRMDTNEGAAYQAGVLAVMASAGLDRAALYTGLDPQTVDADAKPLPLRYGGWGVLDRSGARKPSWYAQWMWQHLGPLRLASTQDSTAAVFSAAGRSDDDKRSVNVFVSTFRAVGAADRTLTLELAGMRRGRWQVALFRVDATHPGSTSPVEIVTARTDRHGVVRVDTQLPAQSVVLARVQRDD